LKKQNILFTGPPQCGKSTLIERLLTHLDRPATGFFTREIRQSGRRTGFGIYTLDGQEGILAREDIKSPYRVGKYGLSLDDLERLGVPAMTTADPDMIVVVDEIGKMECFSELFKKTVWDVLDSKNLVLGSIALKGVGFIKRVKARKDVHLVQVSPNNRDTLVRQYANQLKAGV
jgi:nucleoside-triphosphatase